MSREADLMALMNMVANQRPNITALDGVIATGSYDPSDGTAEFIVGDAYAIDTTTDNYFSNHSGPHQLRFPVATVHNGLQGGPIGGERAILIPRQSGWVILLEHGPDDSPNAPAGELWIQLRHQDAQHAKNNNIKIQNDLAVRIAAEAKVVVNSPVVTLGQEQYQSGNALVRQQDLQQAINAVIQNVQNAFNTLAAIVQPGQGVTSPTVSQVQAQASQTSFTK